MGETTGDGKDQTIPLGNESEKKPGMELADEEPKPRKKREKPVVRIYHNVKGQPTFQPVRGKIEGLPQEGVVTFQSTQEAEKWARKNLTQNGETYQIVTIQREFTVKAEQVPKVSWE